MANDCSTAPLFVEDLLVYFLTENGISFRYRRPLLNSPHRVIKPVFSLEMGKVISHFSSKYKYDYMPIFDKIIEEMQYNPANSGCILQLSTRRLATSLLYDKEDPKKFFIFCAMLGEMFLHCCKKGYRNMMDHVVRGASALIDEKLGWNSDCDLKKYDIYVKDFKVNGI